MTSVTATEGRGVGAVRAVLLLHLRLGGRVAICHEMASVLPAPPRWQMTLVVLAMWQRAIMSAR